MDEEIKINGEPALIPVGGGYEYRREGDKLRAGVIGAGPAGLIALKRLVETDMEVICFEQGPTLGGLWNYSEATGKEDSTGMPNHFFIYRDLRTNLPKEVMMFHNFPYHDLDESYVHSSEVLKYLKHFAHHFDIEKHIKYNHRVKHVKPLLNRWSLTAEDRTSNQEKVYVFDAIFICSGPNATPVYADITMARFSGQQIHSKEYRIPEVYQDKTVLLIGLGPSGLDLAYQLVPVAKKIYLSSNRVNVKITMPENVTLKPVVSGVNDKTVYFTDDTEEEVDCIIHCTGYTYNYPFLDPECGVTVNKYVFPLYKHFISIAKPTMYIIGLPRPINHFYMCDYQVQVAVKYLKNEIELPSQEEMTKEYDEDIRTRVKNGEKKHNFHSLNVSRDNRPYFEALAKLAKIDPVPKVQLDLFEFSHLRSIRDFANFRNYAYRILNDDEYECLELEKPSD